MKNLSVFFPCFNEEKNILRIVGSHIDILTDQSPTLDTRELIAAYTQYLKSFIQMTIYLQNPRECIDNVALSFNSFFAPHLYTLLQRQQASKPIEETLSEQIMESVSEIMDQSGWYFDELGEYDPDDYRTKLAMENRRIESDVLKKILWQFQTPYKDAWTNIWQQIPEQEKARICNDTTGLEAGTTLAWYEGKPINADMETEGKSFSNFIRGWFPRYSLKIPNKNAFKIIPRLSIPHGK